MDKLRALEYFVAAARGQSFSAAARNHNVSVQAIAKLINALEHTLRVRLFERSAQGLSLTSSGAVYLESCASLLAQMAEADEQMKTAATRARGTVVVAVQQVIAQECLSPALPRFHARYPDIQLDLRDFLRDTDDQAEGVDVLLALGWPRTRQLVRRRIGTAGFVVCASPSYWAAHGVPKQPQDLAHHVCLLLRDRTDTVLDLWNFVRGEERVSVAVRGWLVTSNAHRDAVVSAALAGEGVARILDWTNRAELESGALVPVLSDWQSADAPPVNLLYRPSVRRVARVRLFIDFVADLFHELEAGRPLPIIAGEVPRWQRRAYGRASATIVAKPFATD